MKEFLAIIFGTMSVAQWAAFIILAIIGTIAYSGIEVSNRDVASPKTPQKFSFAFLLRDNIKRYIATALLIFINIRFYKELNGQDLTAYTAILIGFGADGIAGFSKRKTKKMQADRDALLKDYPDEAEKPADGSGDKR